MKINMLVLMGVFILFSCKEDLTQRNQELVLGEWAPIDDDNTYNIASYAGYLFEKEYCENKVGYYEYFSQTNSLLEFPYKEIEPFCYIDIDEVLYNVKQPCGYRTLYKLEDDTLLIFDLADKAWIKHQIQFPSKDTMVLSNRFMDDIKDPFVRKTYQIDDQPLIDGFIFYYPASCTSHSKCYLIRRDGLFFSYGYFDANSFLIGRLQDDEFNRLDTLFKKADIDTILNKWCQRDKHSLKKNENVSFVINNRIATTDRKLRSFLGLSVESYWAYLAGLFLPDLASLNPIDKEDYPALLYQFDDFFSITLKDQDYVLNIPGTERFYLGVLLCYAKEITEANFDPKYTMTGFRDKNKTMQTDGRYFSYIYGDQKIILDIGFNFIEVNGLK